MTALPQWWEREDLFYTEDRLQFAGRDVAALCAAFTEPTFLYSGPRMWARVEAVRAALVPLPNRSRVYYAMKANRFRPLLCHLRTQGIDGLDVCSTAEFREALACGYVPMQISYTAHGMSDGDAEFLSHFPEAIVNCDTLSAIRKLGQRCWGRTIGLRINPGVGVGYGNSDKLTYAGEKVTKFGIYPEQLAEAKALAAEYGLTIGVLHCHSGCGVLGPQLAHYDQVLSRIGDFLRELPDVKLLNLGGGLGVVHKQAEEALDLGQWAELLNKHFGQRDLELAVEPGDYFAKDMGMLVLRVNYTEMKKDRPFVGLNGGFNLALEPTFYDMPCVPVPCLRRFGEVVETVVAGNINEAIDIWDPAAHLTPVEEGDLVALLNVGSYSSSMSSNHCMSGTFREILLV